MAASGFDRTWFVHLMTKKNQIKSSFYSLNILLGATNEWHPSPPVCSSARTSSLQQWRAAGNVWEI